MGDVTERWRASVFASLLGNTLVLAVLAVVFAAVLALVLAYAVQLHPSAPVRASARAASMGYALPGAVIAVGVLIPLAGLDRAFSEAATWTFGRSASLAKIPTSLDDAARSLGASIGGTLRRIHLPLMRGGVLTAAILVFVVVIRLSARATDPPLGRGLGPASGV